MKKPRPTGMAQNPIVNAPRGTNSAQSDQEAASQKISGCQYCHKRLAAATPKQKFCSNRCRLLSWAARELVKDLMSGKAKGLNEFFEKLGT